MSGYPHSTFGIPRERVRIETALIAASSEPLDERSPTAGAEGLQMVTEYRASVLGDCADGECDESMRELQLRGRARPQGKTVV